MLRAHTTEVIMRANVFRDINKFGIEEIERPRAGYGEAIVRITLTTICGTDAGARARPRAC